MPKALVRIDDLTPNGTNLADAGLSFVTDTGLKRQTTFSVDFTKSIAQNTTAMKSAVVTACAANGVTLTNADVVTISTPS